MVNTHADDAAVLAENHAKSAVARKKRARSVQYKRAPIGSKSRVDLNEAVRVLDRNREADFWGKVQHGEPDDCWPWMGGRLPKGYGLFGIGEGCHPMLAHRIAYVIGNGPIPDGLVIRHTCHNPPCCNPNHLIAGTYAENEADKKRRKVQP